MSKVVLQGPQDLIGQGFKIVPRATVLDLPLYKAHRTRLERIVANHPGLSARPPFDYQLRYAAMASCRPTNLLAHEQGLGKTYETILMLLAIYGDKLLENKGKPLRRGAILIVAPRHTLKLAWLKEFKILGLDHLVDVVLTEDDVDRCQKPIWLMGYDFLKLQTRYGKALMKRGKLRVKVHRNKTTETYFLGFPMWKKIRQAARPHFLVLDEVHSLRSGSDRTKAVKKLRRGVKRVSMLTGTPIDGWVAHLASILDVGYRSDSVAFPWAPETFTKRFTRERIVDLDYATGESGATPQKKAAPGINPDQIPEFHAATLHLMHRLIYRDPEVTGNVKFPLVEYDLIRVPMDGDQADYYYSLHEQVLTLIADAVKRIEAGSQNRMRNEQNILTNIQHLRRASSCPWAIGEPFEPFEHTNIAKINKLVEDAKMYASEGRKVIVYTNFVATGRALTQALKNAGLGVVRIYAEDKTEKPVHLAQEMREDRIEDFLEDPDLNALVGNLQLLSTGLTLTEASVILNYDHDWRANTYKQGISRIVRPGQVWDHVNVRDYIGDQTVDAYVFAALMAKVKATAELIDHQFNLEDTVVGHSVDPLAIAKALISGNLTIA